MAIQTNNYDPKINGPFEASFSSNAKIVIFQFKTVSFAS